MLIESGMLRMVKPPFIILAHVTHRSVPITVVGTQQHVAHVLYRSNSPYVLTQFIVNRYTLYRT